MPRSQRRASRPRRRAPVVRWAAMATLVVVALLYYRPVKSYLETRATLQQRQAEVQELRAKRNDLARRLEDADTPEALARLSTITCCLSASESLAPKMRASRSVVPPGAAGVMSRIGRLG